MFGADETDGAGGNSGRTEAVQVFGADEAGLKMGTADIL